MSLGRLAKSLCVASSLLALTAGAAVAAPAAKKPPVAAARPATAPAVSPAVEPQALEALSKMSAYLRSLNAFRAHGDTVREEVDDHGQKLQFTGSVTYEVRKPNGFTVTTAEDRRVRKLTYDGKSLTLFSPRMGYYATVAAPTTIRETLDFLHDQYDVTFPLEDLFVWGTEYDWREELTTGYYVGYARIDGQDADQYAFSEPGVDWQIWIARGDKPVPLRITIIGTQDPALPQFQAQNISWEANPQFTDGTFVFSPPAGAIPIKLNQARR